jgi:hypothetical protein
VSKDAGPFAVSHFPFAISSMENGKWKMEIGKFITAETQRVLSPMRDVDVSITSDFADACHSGVMWRLACESAKLDRGIQQAASHCEQFRFQRRLMTHSTNFPRLKELLNRISPAFAAALVLAALLAPNAGAQTIDYLSPTAVLAGSPGLTLVVNGADFDVDSVVVWRGVPMPTRLIRDTQLAAEIPASFLGTPHVAEVHVANGELLSNTESITISATPVLSINSTFPNSAKAGGPGFKLTVGGTGFTRNSVVRWNEQDTLTSFFSSLAVDAFIDESRIAFGGLASVTVQDVITGDVSNTLFFEVRVDGPPPEITQVDPDAIEAGTEELVLVVLGNNFSPTCRVRWNGSERETFFFDTNTLAAVIEAADMERPATIAITVIETAPGGGVSNAVSLFIEQQASSYFGHIVAGGGYSSTLTLVNPGFDEVTGTLHLTGSDGSPLELTIDGSPAAAASLSVALPGGATRRVTLNGPAAATLSGWARIEADGRVSGWATVKFRQSGVLRTSAVVPASPPAESVFLPVENSRTQRRASAVSITNLHDAPIEVSVLVLDEDGSVLAAPEVPALTPLGPRKQVARFLHELYPELDEEFRGSVILTCGFGDSFLAVGLTEEDGIWSLVPPVSEFTDGELESFAGRLRPR